MVIHQFKITIEKSSYVYSFIKVWLAAAAAKGLEIQGTFQRRQREIFMVLTLNNKAMQPMTGFAIQFNKNRYEFDFSLCKYRPFFVFEVATLFILYSNKMFEKCFCTRELHFFPVNTMTSLFMPMFLTVCMPSFRCFSWQSLDITSRAFFRQNFYKDLHFIEFERGISRFAYILLLMP